MGKITKYILRKTIGKRALAEVSARAYNLPDGYKKGISIALDLSGVVANLFLGPGELSDLAITAPINSFWIESAYHDSRWARIGYWEEALPFTDIIPSNYLAHRRYARNKKAARIPPQ